VCAAELDRRWCNPPGTAVRAIYWAYWPPSASTGVDVLQRLLADALAYRDQAA
jgi:hypothetical protein